MSKIAQPGQIGGKSDQRKIYIEWANNKLRKNGFSDTSIHDLQKDTADGVKLPKIIQAVIQEEVPATLPTVSTDTERRQNIEACVAFLQRKGVNCSGFTTKDVSEGSMRAILQLYFSLSQYKGKAAEGDHPPSRISRPTSPSLRMIHSVHSVNNSIPHSNIQPPHSNSHASNPNATKTQGIPTSPLSPPSNVNHSLGSSPGGGGSGGGGGSVHPSGSTLKSRPSQRRTAGSTIPTGMDLMGGGGRRLQYKNVSVLDDSSKRSGSGNSSGDEKKDISPPATVAGKNSDSHHPTENSKPHSSIRGPGLKPPEGSGLKPPEGSGLKPPEGSGHKSHESSGLRHPEGSGLKPPEGSSHKSHESSGLRPPEGSGLKAPEKLSGLRPPEGGVGGNSRIQSGLKSPSGMTSSSLSGLQPSFKSPEGKFQPQSQHKQSDQPSDPSQGGIGGDGSKLKNIKTQRSLSMGRSITPGLGGPVSKLSKPMTSTSDSSIGGGERTSGLVRPGGHLQAPGGHLQAPGGHLQAPGGAGGDQPKSSTLKRENESEESSTGLKPPESFTKSKTLDHRFGSGNNSIPGPSRIGGSGRSAYHSTKLQPKDSEKSTYNLPQHPGGSGGSHLSHKIENSPEPERGSPVPRQSKLTQFRPPGSSGLPSRQMSEPAIKAPAPDGSSKSGSNECLVDEPKPVSKLVLMNKQKPPSSQSPVSVVERKSSDSFSEEKTPEPAAILSEPVTTKTATPDPVVALSPTEKSKLHLAPLEINNSAAETTPTKTADNRSSGSSIASFTSSINSQSESSLLDVQTPSPLELRKGIRRTSPEGMSVDETASPRDLNKLSDLSNESKEEVFSLMSSGEDLQVAKDKENLLAMETALSSKVKRAQSLSPKSSRRIIPLQPQAVITTRATGNPGKMGGGSLENMGSKHNAGVKPTRSSLRTPRQPGESKLGKHVTISPHSSVESFSSSDNSLLHLNSMVMEEKQPMGSRVKRVIQAERPKSLEDLESHSFSIGGYPGDLHPHLLSNSLLRRGSTRSEKLDYSEESFNQRENPTPELLETYENQLSTLKKDLESKAKMLNMYETSMADLSSKVHTLKKTLEEKDIAIKHLTEEKQQSRWNDFPFDQHSLAPSRLDAAALSDGGFSDGMPEYEKEDQSSKKKKKGIIGRFRNKRSKSKDNEGVPSDTVSVAGTIVGNGGKKKSGKNQPHDLISISEYSTIEGKMPEFDAKSVYDTRSEYGGYAQAIPEETGITIFEEEGEGASISVGLLTDNGLVNNASRLDTVLLGSLRIPPETSWVTMDSKICEIFKHHIECIDPEGSLGITDDSIFNYHMGTVSRAVGNALLPHSTPHQTLQDATEISITLKGTLQESCDALAYCLLINASQLHSYIAMLLETQWIVVMGTKGTCKSTLAEGLASYLEILVKEEQTVEDEIGLIGNEDEPLVTRFSIASGIGANGDGLDTAMKFIKQELPHRINRSSRTPILLFDNVYDCQTIEQLIAAAGSLSKRPYIISTLCSGGTTRGVPLHQLMFRHNIRVVTCSPTDEPIYGILMRNLRKRFYRLKADDSVDREAEILVNWLPSLLDHLNYFINKFHSNNVALGPRVFMNCPLEMSAVDMEVWFINLWNHFIIPYLMGTIMAGIETYTADPNLMWIDVREWVMETYPWQQSNNMYKLKTLNPEDVGWNHAVRPQHGRYMYMKDDDTQSVLRGMKPTDMAM